MARWSFVLTDGAFTPQGEVLNASSRKVSLPLNKLSTASMQVRLDNPLADLLMSTNCYLKGYRWTNNQPAPQLRFYGPVVSAEESVNRDTASIAINCVGAGWIMQKRLAGKSATGVNFTSVDRAQIIAQMLGTANADGETHIDYTTGPISAASSVTYNAMYKSILDCNTELSASLDGFDWNIKPVDNWAAGAITGTKIGAYQASPVIGVTQTNAVFEFGTGRSNIVSYKRVVDRNTQANKVYENGPNGPDQPGFPTVSAIDATSISSYGLLEDLAQAQLLDQTLRQRLVDEHVRVRKNPRQIIEFQPHLDPTDAGRLPMFGFDYDIGDTVRSRAFWGGRIRFDVSTRVWGIDFDVNDLGIEQQTLYFAQE